MNLYNKYNCSRNKPYNFGYNCPSCKPPSPNYKNNRSFVENIRLQTINQTINTSCAKDKDYNCVKLHKEEEIFTYHEKEEAHCSDEKDLDLLLYEKEQQKISQKTQPIDEENCTCITQTSSKPPAPVSYTHLDVYKRQAWTAPTCPEINKNRFF